MGRLPGGDHDLSANTMRSKRGFLLAAIADIECFTTAVRVLLFLALMVSGAAARTHHLFVGNLKAPSAIHSVLFDDETLNITRTRSNVADSPHSWISFNHDNTHIFGASLDSPRIASYDVINNSAVALATHVAPRYRCANRTAAFLLVSKRFPHYVFSASFPGSSGCGMSFYVTPGGELADVAATWNYGNRSAISALAFGWGPGQTLYSADFGGDAIWTHYFGFWGEAYFAGRYALPAGSLPRRVVTHPYGKYLYALLEGRNEVVAYVLDPFSASVSRNDSTYSLLPPGYNSSNYWAADLQISRSSRYLWATTRAKPGTSFYGYVSAFLLDNDGFIAKKMFTVPTTTTGGIANSISPAPWDDEWAALTDSPTGYVQMWRMKGQKDTERGTEYSNAEAVARVNITDGGCCSNAIWYN